MLLSDCSRRRFLALASVSAAAFALPTGLFAVAARAGRDPFDGLPDLLGQKIRLRADNGEAFSGRVVDLVTRRRDDLAPRTDHSLLVRTGLRTPLSSQTFVVDHPALPAIPLMMTPVFTGERTVHYELAISRLDHPIPFTPARRHDV